MEQTDFSITVVLDLTGMGALIAQTVFPAIEKAVAATAEKVQVKWQVAVKMVPGVWAGHKLKYADSIDWEARGMQARVWTDEEVAELVEFGFPEFDQKRYLQTSHRTRINKAGQKYLIIPFRHNTPGMTAHAQAMPATVYGMASKTQKSRVIGATTRLSATGATVPQNIYQWGGKLPAGLAGMVRFDVSSGKSKSSAYLTFRVMREDQTGKWIIPAKPGKFVLRNLMGELRPMVETDIQQAVMKAILAHRS